MISRLVTVTVAITLRTAALLAIVLGTSCAGPDPQCQGKCDALTEACIVTLGCAFLQNGNPNPLGEADEYSCIALPERCSEERTCDCLLCSGQNDADCVLAPAGAACSEAVNAGPVRVIHGCE